MVTDSNSAEPLPEGFAAYYDSTIEPELQQLEGKRRNGIRIFIALAGVAALGIVAIIANMMLDGFGGDTLVGAGFVLLFGAAGAAVWLQFYLRKLIKAALVAPTCRFLGYEYKRKAEGFPVERFYDLRLIRKRRETSTSTEDEIAGTQNGLPFRLCEVEIKDQSKAGDDDNSSRKNIVFHGVLFVCKLPKAVKAETRILHSADFRLLPKETADGDPIEAVHLEESRFSQSFHVYSSDQVEARYLLNPSFMERLTDLMQHFNPLDRATRELEGAAQSGFLQTLVSKTNAVSVVFVGSEMLISIHSGDNRFEGGSLRKPLTDRARVEALLQELRIVPAILDTLELGDEQLQEAAM